MWGSSASSKYDYWCARRQDCGALAAHHRQRHLRVPIRLLLRAPPAHPAVAEEDVGRFHRRRYRHGDRRPARTCSTVARI